MVFERNRRNRSLQGAQPQALTGSEVHLGRPRQVGSEVVCGIDERSGGTWLGVHARRGHFATLTNIGGRE